MVERLSHRVSPEGYEEIRRTFLDPIREVNTFTTLDIEGRNLVFTHNVYTCVCVCMIIRKIELKRRGNDLGIEFSSWIL